jgi:hypothetical protein
MRTLLVTVIAIALISCSSETKPAKEAPAPVPAQKPADESRRFPSTDLLQTSVVEKEIAGKPFMPGGTVAKYRKGKTEYEMFVARAASPTHAAIALSDWRKVLTDPKLVASFGGYMGQDNGVPTFVFSKGQWIAGVRGLSDKQADLAARTLAARLD